VKFSSRERAAGSRAKEEEEAEEEVAADEAGACSKERGVECDERLRAPGGGIASDGRDGEGSRRECRLSPGRAITGRVGGRARPDEDEDDEEDEDGEVDSRVGVLVRAMVLARALARSSEYLWNFARNTLDK
jgi:hypothetical protein